eukprot:TRINITY_DN24923_c0_g1_i1.p1 TRINITY_DN24923_c0_g1~~TRINITY_DN24923_c0_g1_i1.p1  ORF type:complete len:318 (+),score=43.48 TRINITY_DN24923_c0_g1_i1:56-1009(+)
MSFAAAGWSDEEKDKGGVMGSGDVAAAPVVKKKRVIKRRLVGGGAVLEKPTVKKVARKRGREDEGEMEVEEEGGAAVHGTKRMKNLEGKSVKRDLPPAPLPPPGVGRFHVITDPEFSDIALPRPGHDGRSGSWIGSQCRCLQCETTRVASKLRQKTTICILDLDNYGYPQWVRQPAPPGLHSMGAPPPNLFIWGFYGLGFEAHGHKGDPLDAISSRSLFGMFKKTNQLHLSPCGNYPQAADEAMQKMVDVLRNMNLAVVSSDKPHLRACGKAHANQTILPGRVHKDFVAVNPSTLGMDSAAVWKRVADFAAEHPVEE